MKESEYLLEVEIHGTLRMRDGFVFFNERKNRGEEKREWTTSLLKLSRLFVQIRHSGLRNEGPPLNAPLEIDSERTRKIQPHFLFLTEKC